MTQQDSGKKSALILSAVGVVPLIWLALKVAPFISGGLEGVMKGMPKIFEQPFNIQICGDSFRTVLVLLLCYGFGIAIYFSTLRNYRKGEEHGSAKWGSASKVNHKYKQRPNSNNKLLTQNVCIGLNTKKHRRNLNTIVVGGSGAGKTRFYCKPNLMQANTSFVVLDPKGEMLRDTGNLLLSKGYELKVLDLLHMEKSHCYNPFVYIRNDDEAQKLVTNLFKATTPKDAQSNDPFWEDTAKMLLMALVLYLYHEAPIEEQNFGMIMEMLRAANIEGDDVSIPSALDILFDQLRYDAPDHIAVRYYDMYHKGAAKTLQSIQITLASHLGSTFEEVVEYFCTECEGKNCSADSGS